MLFSLSFGCSTVRTVPLDTSVYSTVSSAALAVPDIAAELRRGSFTRIKITDDSPAIALANTRGKFEVVSLAGKAGEQFEISVAAPCNCFGFKKTIVMPLAYVVDPRGKTVSESTIKNSVGQVLRGTFPSEGRYKVIVVADEDPAGNSVRKMDIPVPLPHMPLASIAWPLIPSDTGRVHVLWR